MILAAYYTRHNTLVVMLVFLAVFSLVALIVHRVRLRHPRELPYGIRPTTVYEPKLDQWPMPGSYEEIMGHMAEYGHELQDQLITEWVIGPRPLVDAWSLIEPDFQTGSV